MRSTAVGARSAPGNLRRAPASRERGGMLCMVHNMHPFCETRYTAQLTSREQSFRLAPPLSALTQASKQLDALQDRGDHNPNIGENYGSFTQRTEQRVKQDRARRTHASPWDF